MPKKTTATTNQKLIPMEFTADEIKFLREAVEYHGDCWLSMYNNQYKGLYKAVKKKLG